MRVVEGDLMNVTGGLVLHQVNTEGVMGAGVAKLMAERHPEMFKHYRDICNDFDVKDVLMGRVMPWQVNDQLRIGNVFAQDLKGSGRRTSYDATDEAWARIAEMRYHGESVWLPYKMGCALGGGEWSIYSAIVDFHCPDAIAVRLPGT